MDLAIGLPNAVPGTKAEQLIEWARRAEARGFSSLGTLDRIVYDSWEPLTVFAAAAAVTERIGLISAVVLGPLHGNPAALAKRTKTLQALSGGRFTLGIGLGDRDDDYVRAGVSKGDRAYLIDEQLQQLREDWADDAIGPATDPPRILVGGYIEASFKRAARFGDGWIAGGLGPEEFAQSAAGVKAAFAEAGRGEPRLAALAYFSLGDRAEEDAKDSLGGYYEWLGEDTANAIADAAVKSADEVQGAMAAYADAGCEELILFPSSPDPEQVDLLADAAGITAAAGV
jgi:alkanesulfonate monooxygenase SsuD/methylene tetrahydromethanopterin reductase-like flavin-dependent oxidoreductase (luciferase family)